MKRGLTCAICILLVLIHAVTGSAATTLTLPEKLEKQMSVGNGLKGTVLLQGEGTDPFLFSLEPILDVPLQVRGMKPEKDWHYYLYQSGAEETQKGLTELYCKDGKYYFRSDLVPDHVFVLPEPAEILDEITAPEGGNPSFVSALMNILTMSEEQKTAQWKPFVEKTAKKAEIWLMNYKVSSGLVPGENGETLVEQNYTIPMAELKKEILRLVSDIRNDADTMTMINQLLSKKQQKTYLNENLDYFYLEAMDALEDDFDVTLSRILTVMGEEISSFIELPLDQSRYGYSALEMTRDQGKLTCRLTNDSRSVLFVTEDDLMSEEAFRGITCWVMSIPSSEAEEGATGSAARIEIQKKTENYSDESTGDHQKDQWTLEIRHDLSRLPEEEKAKHYAETAPVSAGLTLHYYSKYSQSSPTKLDISASLDTETMNLSLEGQFKTATPWIFSPFDISTAEDFLQLKDETKVFYLAEWLAAAGEQFNKQEEMTEDALPEATDAPASDTQGEET